MTPSKSGAEPVDDLLHARGLALAFLRADRGVGGEQDALIEADRIALAEAGERRDLQALLAERRPVALRVVDQLVGFGDPDGAAAALHPVVEDDAGGLPALARAGAVAEEPAAAEAHGALGVVGGGGDRVEGGIDLPGAGQMPAMGFAGIDDAFELGLGQDALADEALRQMRPVGGLRRRDRGHGGRLHQGGRVRLRAGNADRLQAVAFIDRVGQAAAGGRRPLAGFVGKRFRRLRGRCRDGPRRPGRNSRTGLRPQGRGQGLKRRGDGLRARRQAGLQGREQGGKIRRLCGRGRKMIGAIGRNPVDHGQARVDRRAVPGVEPAVDRRGEDNARLVLQGEEFVAEGGIVRRLAGPGDGDQAAAGREAAERGGDMAQGGVGDAALDMGAGREGRIHQDDGRAQRRREVVMDMGGVVLADGSVGEDPAQEGGAMIGKLVEDQARAGELGMDGEQAGAGGRFQHRVGGRQRRGAGGDMRDRQRRRQLLQGLALGRALGVGRQQRGNPLQHGQPCARPGVAQGRGEGAQEEELRDFAGIVGVLPQPMPFGIAAAEGGDHGLAQHGGA